MGCEPLGGADWGTVDIAEAEAVVRAAWDAGIRVFDTADVYGLGKSEQRLARALGSVRHDAVIVSKFGVRWRPVPGARAATWKDASPSHLVLALESSLRRLQIDRIPVYLVHWPDARTALDDTLAELERQRLAGKIGVYGVSNHWGSELTKAMALGASIAELPLSLVDMRADIEMSRCASSGLDVLAYGVYAQGLLCGNYDRASRFGDDDRRGRLSQFSEDTWDANETVLAQLALIAGKRGVSMASVALRWVLDHEAVSLAIVGMKTRAQLADALSALTWELEAAEADGLREAGAHAARLTVS